MEMLLCHVQDRKNNIHPNNCSLSENSTMFQNCLANFQKDTFDNFMLFFSEILPICTYFKEASPILTPEDIAKVCLLSLCAPLQLPFQSAIESLDIVWSWLEQFPGLCIFISNFIPLPRLIL